MTSVSPKEITKAMLIGEIRAKGVSHRVLRKGAQGEGLPGFSHCEG
jgi:hypothetical protein